MKRLFDWGSAYIRECDWKDLALVKFCLCAMGALIGLCVPEKKRKIPLILAGLVFLATYIPLMVNFGRMVCRSLSSDTE